MTNTTNTRFQPSDAVIHNGRPAIVACVDPTGTSPRYSIYYTDEQGGTVLDLLGRVLSTVR